MTAAPRKVMSYAEYLAFERSNDIRHEYLRGEVFAMAGGTPEHGRLASSLGAELRRLLGDRPCEVFPSDVRVRVVATDRATYPDLSVVCGKLETAPEDPDALINPIVIVEVLSDSTEADDRGEKFAHYRRIPSLREHVLVAQRAERIEVFRRQGDVWALSESGAGGFARLESIDVDVPVDAVYRNRLAAE